MNEPTGHNVYLVVTETTDVDGKDVGEARTIVRANSMRHAMEKLAKAPEFARKTLDVDNVKSIQLMENDVVTIHIGTAVPF